MCNARKTWFCLLIVALAAPVVSAQVAFTTGPGNDTEARWSPDGSSIAFQSDRNGNLDIYVANAKTGETTPLVAGEGDAFYPAWSPDGSLLAYCYGNIRKTAVQGIEAGYNIYVMPASGGAPVRLTESLDHDSTPSFSPDGKYIYFSSTRGMENAAIGIQRVPVAGGDIETVTARQATDVSMMQPDASSDGRFVAFGFLQGFRSNWSIRLMKTDNPESQFQLTDTETPMYAPRWSPDGKLIACTGYRPGDPGWGIYMIEAGTGSLARLDTGPGNSRTPGWSPDGGQIVFENNRSGSYRLYRMDVPKLTFERRPGDVDEELKPIVSFSFAEKPEGTVADLTGNGNDGKIVGDVPWQDGALVFGGGGYITIPEPKGVEFGTGSFSAEATVIVDEHNSALRLISVCQYPDSRLGWQFFLNEQNILYFNARGVSGEFLAGSTSEPLPIGRKVHLLGIRHRSGLVELFVDGVRQAGSGSRAKFSYGKATQLRIGTQQDGTSAFAGKVCDFRVFSGVVDSGEGRAKTLAEFLESQMGAGPEKDQ